MCGISGIVVTAHGSRRIEHAELLWRIRRMGLFQFHRGPDDWGEFVTDGVALGHNRLAILDIEGGKQPMSISDELLHVVFNGEIYNFLELRVQLVKLGHLFATDHSDTEVILHGYRQWGVKIFERLEGMFAIALWDTAERRLIIARDRLGIKPLYYSSQGDIFTFASEPKAILASGLLESTNLRAEAFAEYFLLRAPAFGSFFQSIGKLPGGTWAEWQDGVLNGPYTYWTPKIMAQRPEEIRNAIGQAVNSHLLADVPLGVFLSGGVDSSLVAALMAQQAQGGEVHAYSIGLDGDDLDETPMARRVAEHLGISLHTRFVTAKDMLGGLEKWCYVNDDPVSDPSALALMLLCEHARNHGMKVMLSGEGADELFGGYNSYIRFGTLAKLGKLPASIFIKSALAQWRNKRDGDYLCQSGKGFFLGTAHPADHGTRTGILLPDHQWTVNGLEATLAGWWEETTVDYGKEPLRHAMLMDQLFRLPNDILPRTDRASMAWSLEARVPFLDRRVVDVANSLPDNACMKLFPRYTKTSLKSLVRQLVPASVVDRPKRGFDLPLGKWLREDLAEVGFDALQKRNISGLNYETIGKLWHAHAVAETRYTPILWAWLMLEQWHNKWVRSDLSYHPPSVSSYNRGAFDVLKGSSGNFVQSKG